ncbi:MAG: DEAD/DEAH box helicase [Amedibacillus dolichus]|uniref:DEAD/DEAH box helicase n=1 Tax=Amedibacillus dolichus TaxID=31971 RepID=A0A942WAL7_9FIRM|nr:DEAD/DEAH box helicase [Amedibacillus dolichus]MBS4885046.1 DEAD/DEAH box helicase [Amedibacillus dolichus]MEE0383605.1 DEAD/DEAH box helicase [Amedibacillus dolichus]
MLKIQPSTLYSVVSDTTSIRLSESYYRYDNVEEIHITFDTDMYMYCVIARVNVLGKLSQCRLWIDEEGNVDSYQCHRLFETKQRDSSIVSYERDCPWCNEESACGDIGAVLLKLAALPDETIPFHYISEKRLSQEEKEKRRQEEYRKQQRNRMLAFGKTMLREQKRAYENKIVSLTQHQQYELQPELAYDHVDEKLYVSFRIGAQKKYVLKDIETFLERIENHIHYKYGKQLEFVHCMEAFDERSRKQISLLKQWCEERQQAHLEYNGYYYGYSRITRSLALSENEIDAFFDLYDGQDTEFTLIKTERRIRILVQEEGDLLHFSYDDEKLIVGNKHLYTITQEVGQTVELCQITLDSEGKTMSFLNDITSNVLYIEKKEYAAFYKYVISDIQPYLDIIGLECLKELPEPYSVIKLYGDIDANGQMYIKLNYYNEEGERGEGFDDNPITSYAQDVVEAYIKSYASIIDYDAHIAYFDMDREDAYTFVLEGLSFLNSYCEIYVSDALKNLEKEHHYTIQVGVRIENDLLGIDIQSLEIPKEELSAVLRSYRRKRKFYRLKNGNLLNLNSPQLKELDDMLESYHLSGNDLVDGKATMEAYRLFSMNDKANQAQYLDIQRSAQFQAKIDQFYSSKNKSYPLPSPYDKILRDYQKEGVQWLSMMRDSGFNGILADDMGLGKTLQVIALLDSKVSGKTSIVICPASLIYNWEDEIHRFSKTLKCKCICGNAKQRAQEIASYSQYDVLLTSYDYIRRDIELYEAMTFYYVILDEAQYIKNQKTRNALCVKKLKAEHKLALTGTPIENSLAELWSIFDFLMPDYLFNYHYFQAHYESEIVKNHNEEVQQKLKKLVAPFVLRRNKKEVLRELPDKIEQNYIIDFSEEENKLYVAHLAQVNRELSQMVNMQSTDKITILAMLTKLRQLCCEPRLVFENIHEPSSKLKACIHLIQTLKENKQKVLLFSSFTSMLELIADELYKEGISYYILTGATNKEERRELVERFQNDSTTVFLISLKAGGTGLNLTSAEAVIHYDPWWNQSAQNQATDRAYRIGQRKKVQVFKLVMKNSIEEKIQKLQLMKKELADMFVENNETNLAKMSKEELLSLFEI